AAASHPGLSAARGAGQEAAAAQRPAWQPGAAVVLVALAAADDLDAVLQLRLAGNADRPLGDGVQGDVPEAAGRHADLRREADEGAAVVAVPPAVAERSEVGVVHQADIAGLRALDDD